MQFKEIFKNGWVRVGIFITVIITSVWFYNYFVTKKECEQLVSYVPDYEKPIFGGIEKESAHFFYYGKKFETHKEAMRYCVSRKTD